jgi:hypothetical protein
MSNVFVTSIDGTGIYAIPTSDATLAAAQAGLQALIGTVPSLTFGGVFAWVKDSDGGSPRTLNCLISDARVAGAKCPDDTDTQQLFTDIKNTLEADALISSVSVQEANLVDEGSGGGVLPGITNTIFVAKRSNLIEDGSLENPFHTFTAAIAEALSRSPSTVNPQTIWGYPGIFAESFTVPNYVSIEAPGSRIDGNIQLGASVTVRIKELRVTSGIGVLKPIGSVGTARFEADTVVCSGNAIGGVNLSIGTGAVLMVEVKTTIIEDGLAYGDITTDNGHMHLQCEDIYIAGAGIGVVRTGIGTTEGYVAHILEVGAGVGFGTAIQVAAGDVDLFCHRIACATAVNVGPPATLRLFASVIGGAQVVAGTFLTAVPV